VGVIIGALAIAAIAAIGAVEHTEVQNTNVIYIKELLIAMLVLLIFIGLVSLAVCYKNIRYLSKSVHNQNNAFLCLILFKLGIKKRYPLQKFSSLF
jgi:hypothetical protein